MAQSFPIKSAPCYQSTPKPLLYLVSPPEQDHSEGRDALNLSVPEDDPLPFVAPDDDQEQHSVDSGVFMNISSINESTDPHRSEIPAEEGAEAEIFCDPRCEKIEEIPEKFSGPEDIEEGLLRKVNAACLEINEQFSSWEQLSSQQSLTDGDMEGNSSESGCF